MQCCHGLSLLLALHFFASTVEYTKLVWSSLSLSLLSRGWPGNPFRASRGSARFTATGSSFRKSSSLQQAPAGAGRGAPMELAHRPSHSWRRFARHLIC